MANPLFPAPTAARSGPFGFLPDGGECGALLRATDWSKTSVGPVESWPPSLRIGLGLVMDNKFGMYIAWGKDFTQFYNDGYRRILGSTKHPAAMGNTADRTFSESWHLIEPLFQRVMNGESVGADDWHLPLDRNGYLEDCYFTFSYSPIRDDQSRVGGILVTVTETTERVRREAETLDVLESMDEAFFSVDTRWNVLRVNAKHEKVTQIPRADQLGKSLLDLYFADPSHRQSKYWINYHRAMNERVAIHFEDYYEPLDLWTSVNVYPKADGGLAVFYRDTTQTKKIEKSIEQSELLFRTLADTIPLLAWMAHADGYIHWYNQNWYEFTGTTPAQMEGWGWQSVHDPKELPRVVEAWTESIRTGQTFTMEFPLRGQDGKLRWFLTRAVPVHNDDGEVVRWIGTNTDIDEQRQKISRLETQKSLREQFVSTLSHDLRTPLTAAKMCAQLIGRSSHSPEKVVTLTGRIVDNLHRANQMIENLLDANRVEAGEPLQLEIEPFDLRSIVVDTLDNLASVHGDRFRLISSESVVDGYWSKEALRRILENLCGNAVKYGGERTPIDVRVVRTSESVTLSVHNMGNSIPSGILMSLFDPFKRGETATFARGWGIGLTLVKALTEALGGAVSAESSSEQGTVFRVHLPLDARNACTRQ